MVQVGNSIASGIHGSCSWNITKDGVLRIYPTNGTRGELDDQNLRSYHSPWKMYHNQIFGIKVEKGVHTGRNANCLFAGLDKCKEMDLSGLDTSKAQKISCMFFDCKELKGLNVKNLETRNVIDASYIFKGCENLERLDLGGLNLRNVLNATGMFQDCKSLEELYMGSFRLDEVSRRNFVFAGCNKLKNKHLLEQFGGSQYEKLFSHEFKQAWYSGNRAEAKRHILQRNKSEEEPVWTPRKASSQDKIKTSEEIER